MHPNFHFEYTQRNNQAYIREWVIECITVVMLMYNILRERKDGWIDVASESGRKEGSITFSDAVVIDVNYGWTKRQCGLFGRLERRRRTGQIRPFARAIGTQLISAYASSYLNNIINCCCCDSCRRRSGTKSTSDTRSTSGPFSNSSAFWPWSSFPQKRPIRR